MKATGIIPARFDSKRFRGKLLKQIQGKPLLWHTYNMVKQSKLLNRVIIATDSKKIQKVAEDFGAEVIMTTSEAITGTDRIAKVAESLTSEVIINIQGDEPLIASSIIDKLVQVLYDDDSLHIVTAAYKSNNINELKDPNVVKVVKDEDDFALYFSRSLIPYPKNEENLQFYKHLGIYAYRRPFILTFSTLAPSSLERIEGLEQLRVLEYGYKIKIIESKHDSVGVDTPKDLEKVIKIMEEKNA